MNEFTGKSKEKLEKIKLGLESYLQGCVDTYAIYQDVFDRTLKLYKEKIRQCEEELNKDNHESDN